MRITKKFIRSLGFKTTVGHVVIKREIIDRLGSYKSIPYPFNQMEFCWTKKGLIIISSNGTKYSCNTIEKLLASVYFVGINKGMLDKEKQLQKMLGLKNPVTP